MSFAHVLQLAFPRPLHAAQSIDQQPPKQRVPRQARAVEKVELILEAAVRLLESDGIESLNTNALAEKAGVSIGTLYQYFKNKDAILAALADREMAKRSTKILSSLQEASGGGPAERIRAMTRAALDAYGGRRRAHRQVMNHALGRNGPSRLAPLIGQLNSLLVNRKMSATDAFVLTQAVTGVLRAVIAQGDGAPPREELEESLTRMILGFMQAKSA